MQQLTPFIWLDGNAEEAMTFYVETFPNSRIVHIERYSGDQGIPDEETLKGKVLTGIFEVCGVQMMCLDGGPHFPPGGNMSLLVELDTQDELDAVWERLLEGGTPMQCGWIIDRFGTTWQVTPKAFGALMMDPATTAEQKQALMAAMMPMVKLDMPSLQAAYESARTG
ncbi:MAG TPA: VOC family protein [Mycobacteriales bacterium]|nr:VOC family protein [Mycobacteriales bacterium]